MPQRQAPDSPDLEDDFAFLDALISHEQCNRGNRDDTPEEPDRSIIDVCLDNEPASRCFSLCFRLSRWSASVH
jgi:hypothetical protein